MNYSEIRYAEFEGAATITLARPERKNALTFEMIGEIRDAIRRARDSEAALLILRGEGDTFCSGDNLFDMGVDPFPNDHRRSLEEFWYEAIVKDLRALPKPVVCLAQGYVLGAGLELLMAADIKIVEAKARLGLPFARYGTVAMNYHLPRYIGFTRAARMLFTGDLIDGDTAVAWGLATEACAGAQELESRLEYWTQKFSAIPTGPLGLMKGTFYKAFDLAEDDWYRWWMTYWMARLMRPEDGASDEVDWRSAAPADFITASKEPDDSNK